MASSDDISAETPPARPAHRSGVTRRTLLAAGATTAVGIAVATPALASSRPSPKLPDEVFALGVASGDPLPEAVVIWTRLAPDPLRLDGTGGMPPETFPVDWEIAEDELFQKVVHRGTWPATADDAHSVHVDVRGLRAGREYYYRFRAGGQISPAGRTRTAPVPGSRPARVRFATASCQRFTDGYYTAYQDMLRYDPDLVFHLGDYFYEKDNGAGPVGRQHLPIGECMTLPDYRVRIAQVRMDPDMLAIHASAPFVVTFDDHEVSGNYAGDIPETGQGADATVEEFRLRKAAAYKSYWEHMPLRSAQRPSGSDMQVYRRLYWGKLATFTILDTRQYRSNQVTDADSPEAYDPSRTILGAQQERWLLKHLKHTGASWDVLAQQVPFFADPDIGHPEDKWDGYRAARENILRGMAANPNCHPVVLSGDIHKHRAADLKRDFSDPASKTLGVEFTTTSISSSSRIGVDEKVTAKFDPVPETPHLRFAGNGRGYVTVELTPGQLRADFRAVTTILSTSSPSSTVASFVSDPVRPGLRRA
ncbi:alkaline phosphatase D family protein [Dactylosporangium roseum]|uniref:Alkaline phosphatase D family protein n=1 Tax=Dactylosporangium roseum TaxID=47989 RepID=A0ABY5YY91_9ACTN|nr:alkaline phosphatase D family protein [Dactylosporangium roseum]UWZ34720.1 alkaline phosphatase D family protein [Dactylosporangium roseum]